MRRRQASVSALGIAAVRALESEKPESIRLLCDPYARRLVPRWLYAVIKLSIQAGWTERRGPGVIGYLTVRDRYIDDVLEVHLSEGIAQLVILGAGLDARAYRFDALKQGVRVFEVDHPASQESKLRKLHKILGALPPYVTYVGMDFNNQSLETRLLESGYDPTAKTLFIWQGVTQYLTPSAVDDTLDFVARLSGPRSAIVFDYLEPRILANPGDYGEVIGMRRHRWLTGETLTFGIPIAQIERFLAARGFCDVTNVDGKWLAQRYYPDGSQRVTGNYAIAWARVAPQRRRV